MDFAKFAAEWPELMIPCRYCSEFRHKLDKLRAELGGVYGRNVVAAWPIGKQEIDCQHCKSTGFVLTDKGDALREFFVFLAAVAPKEEEIAF